MAESEQGIHPEVVRQLTDLHRKHAELQMSMHDKGGDESEPHAIFHQMLEELQKLNANLEKLLPAIEADTKADLKEAGADKGEKKEPKNERRRERASTSGVSGESSSSA